MNCHIVRRGRACQADQKYDSRVQRRVKELPHYSSLLALEIVVTRQRTRAVKLKQPGNQTHIAGVNGVSAQAGFDARNTLGTVGRRASEDRPTVEWACSTQ